MQGPGVAAHSISMIIELPLRARHDGARLSLAKTPRGPRCARQVGQATSGKSVCSVRPAAAKLEIVG